MLTPESETVRLDLRADRPADSESGTVRYAVRDIAELAIERDHLWPESFGPMGLQIRLFDGETLLESWPEDDPLEFEVPEKNQELFWPS